MRVRVFLAAMATATVFAAAAQAQDRVWIQVEARPNLSQGEDRARAWSTAFGDVTGYRLSSGWYGVVLGPYDPAQAAARLGELKAQGMIPPDSYITDGRPFRETYWAGGARPQVTITVPGSGNAVSGGALPAPSPEVTVLKPATPPAQEAPPPADVAAAEPAPEPVREPTPAAIDETPEEARAAEARLSAEGRMELQTALKWFGFYDSAVDGAFGKGTRASMAAWQDAQGFAPTGILTTAQRAKLTGGFEADRREFGFETVTEAESGIEIALPLAMVGFDHYEPPFVHYAEKDGSGFRVVLISAPGDESTLAGLYETLQTLTILPADGPRKRDARSFTIEGNSPEHHSYAQAELVKGGVKGFILTGPPEKALQFARILPAMKAGFRSVGDRALDPGLVPMDAATRAGLMSGLEVKRPRLSRSGFFVDAKGTVATTAEAVANCGRITLDRETEAKLLLSDAATGIALLTPVTAMAPARVAGLRTAPDRAGAELAVSGYSYEDRLPAPVLTFGALAEAGGLNGEAGLTRLSIPVLAGDAGGPVIDQTGAVVGMLLPASGGARVLPEGVAFAADAGTLSAVLARAGVATTTAATTTPATPDVLAHDAAAITVLVSCWE